MKSIRIHIALMLAALIGSAARAHDKSAALDDTQKTFLAQYEKVRAALADDDLGSAKSAAAPLAKDLAEVAKEQTKAQGAADAAKKLASAGSLVDAREAFKAVSKRAAHYAQGQKGYYVATARGDVLASPRPAVPVIDRVIVARFAPGQPHVSSPLSPAPAPLPVAAGAALRVARWAARRW